jgi:hypothetical protein
MARRVLSIRGRRCGVVALPQMVTMAILRAAEGTAMMLQATTMTMGASLGLGISGNSAKAATTRRKISRMRLAVTTRLRWRCT